MSQTTDPAQLASRLQLGHHRGVRCISVRQSGKRVGFWQEELHTKLLWPVNQRSEFHNQWHTMHNGRHRVLT